MYLYFDSTGKLLKSLTHGFPARTGSEKFEIFAYFNTSTTYPSASLRLVNPDGVSRTTLPIQMTPSHTEHFTKTEYETTESIEPFVNNTDYTGFYYDFEDAETILLNAPGLWKAYIELYDAGGNIAVSGQITFACQDGPIPATDEEYTLEDALNDVLRILATKANVKGNEVVRFVSSVSGPFEANEYSSGDILFNTTDKRMYVLDSNLSASQLVMPYQDKIDSTHKLSSDLVDDTGHTNKFVTEAQRTKIDASVEKINTILRFEHLADARDASLYANGQVILAMDTGKYWQSNGTNWTEKFDIKDTIKKGTGSGIQTINDGLSVGNNLNVGISLTVANNVNVGNTLNVENADSIAFEGGGTLQDSLDTITDYVDEEVGDEEDERTAADTELQNQINALKQRGKLLSNWDAIAGLPISFPETTPYTYKSGDYYVIAVTVGSVANYSSLSTYNSGDYAKHENAIYKCNTTISTPEEWDSSKWDVVSNPTNHKPSGTSYTGTASTVAELSEISVGDTYNFDGIETWLLQKNVLPSNVALKDGNNTFTENNTFDFNKVIDSETNTSLKTKLNAKQDTLVSGTNIKTINGESVVGSGNIIIRPSSVYRVSYSDTAPTEQSYGRGYSFYYTEDDVVLGTWADFINHVGGANAVCMNSAFNSNNGTISISDAINGSYIIAKRNNSYPYEYYVVRTYIWRVYNLPSKVVFFVSEQNVPDRYSAPAMLGVNAESFEAKLKAYNIEDGTGTSSLEQISTIASDKLVGFGNAKNKTDLTTRVQTKATGVGSFAEGSSTLAEGYSSHAEGQLTYAALDGAHAEGAVTAALGGSSHAEGYQTVAGANDSHVEGSGGQAYGQSSHVEGNGCFTGNPWLQGAPVVDENYGVGAHAEGYGTYAVGKWSHAEGGLTQAIGNYSHAGGYETRAQHLYQTAIGKYNNNKLDTLFEVGNGTDGFSDRSNAFEVLASGGFRLGGTSFTESNILTTDTDQVITSTKTIKRKPLQFTNSSDEIIGKIEYENADSTFDVTAVKNNLELKSLDNNVTIFSKNTSIALADYGSGRYFYPEVDGNVDLGISNYRWNDLWLKGNLSDGTNSVSVANIKATLGSVITNTTDTTISLIAGSGLTYVFTQPITSATISSLSETTGDLKPEWNLQFKAGSGLNAITFPSGITVNWAGGTAPTFISGQEYKIEIVKGVEANTYIAKNWTTSVPEANYELISDETLTEDVTTYSKIFSNEYKKIIILYFVNSGTDISNITISLKNVDNTTNILYCAQASRNSLRDGRLDTYYEIVNGFSIYNSTYYPSQGEGYTSSGGERKLSQSLNKLTKLKKSILGIYITTAKTNERIVIYGVRE